MEHMESQGNNGGSMKESIDWIDLEDMRRGMLGLETLADETDRKFAEMANVCPKLTTFAGHYNPMHVFCRVIELGVDRREAYRLAKEYEKNFYTPLQQILKDSKK
jgi:hypothetical protein